MLFAIEGFSQSLVVQLSKTADVSIDVLDLVILRWFIVMKGLDLMEKITIGGVEYVWICFSWVMENIPLLGITSADRISRRFAKYVRLGLLKRCVKKLGRSRGAKSYFAVTEVLCNLIVTKDSFRHGANARSKAIDTAQTPYQDGALAPGQNKRKEEESAVSDDAASLDQMIAEFSPEAPTSEAEIDPVEPPPKYSTEHLELATYLADSIESEDAKHFAGKNRGKTISAWSNDIRKLETIDKRSIPEIERVLRWSRAQDFWKPNILSADKFRKQFPRLLVEMKGRNGNGSRAGETESQRLERLATLEEREVTF